MIGDYGVLQYCVIIKTVLYSFFLQKLCWINTIYKNVKMLPIKLSMTLNNQNIIDFIEGR